MPFDYLSKLRMKFLDPIVLAKKVYDKCEIVYNYLQSQLQLYIEEQHDYQLWIMSANSQILKLMKICETIQEIFQQKELIEASTDLQNNLKFCIHNLDLLIQLICEERLSISGDCGLELYIKRLSDELKHHSLKN